MVAGLLSKVLAFETCTASILSNICMRPAHAQLNLTKKKKRMIIVIFKTNITNQKSIHSRNKPATNPLTL